MRGNLETEVVGYCSDPADQGDATIRPKTDLFDPGACNMRFTTVSDSATSCVAKSESDRADNSLSGTSRGGTFVLKCGAPIVLEQARGTYERQVRRSVATGPDASGVEATLVAGGSWQIRTPWSWST
jgi:hypothetical protein